MAMSRRRGLKADSESVTRIGRQQPEDRPSEGGLAGTAFADQAERFAGPQCERGAEHRVDMGIRHAVEHGLERAHGAEAHPEIVDLQQLAVVVDGIGLAVRSCRPG
jgi:hypothetical protein